MRADKVIVRAILSTVAAIVVLFGFMMLALVAFYPSTLMHVAYDLGMDEASIKNARRAYERSDEVYYIAFATEVAIGSDDYGEIEKCGERFILDDGFDGYCAARDQEYGETGAYERYVQAQVCTAKYRLGKKDDAVSKAFAFTGNTFPKNNAVVGVLITAISARDITCVESIKNRMEDISTEIPETDKEDFDKLLQIATAFLQTEE